MTTTQHKSAKNSAPELVATCGCGRTCRTRPAKDGTPKTPRGWRRMEEELVCRDCLKARYYVRAIRVEITGLADEELRSMAEFRAALIAAARESARFGNWLVQRLFAADPAASMPRQSWPTTKDGKPKLPPMPAVNWYAPAEFPELSGAAMSGLGKMVSDWYGRRRFEMFAMLSRSLESYRFGYLPIEVRAADWKIVEHEGRYIFRRVPVGPGKSWSTKVYCDRRNLAVLKACASGEAVPLGMKIVRAAKRLSNGQPVKAWFYRVAVLLPRRPARQSHVERTLTLGHDAVVLLFGSLEDREEVFEYAAPSLREMIVNGDKADRRRQQEQSMTRRLVSRRGHARWHRRRTDILHRRRRQIDHQLHLATAVLVRWCQSHGVTSVDYDATDRGFVPHCPWRKLRDYIACGLESEGIALHVLGSESTEGGSGLLADSVALAGPEGETS